LDSTALVQTASQVTTTPSYH